jgi:hypothetical protein
LSRLLDLSKPSKKHKSKEEMRTTVLISALVLLLVANFLMMYVTPFGLVNMEGFTDASGSTVVTQKGTTITASTTGTATTATPSTGVMTTTAASQPAPATGSASMLMPTGSSAALMPTRSATEGFATYSLATGGGAGDAYQAMGAFDNVRLATGNNVSKWRYTAPDEPLSGPEVKLGPDSLFMFKNNQCKPECCGASFSCNGGCVCTSAKQREYLNQRGGNRTAPDDGV